MRTLRAMNHISEMQQSDILSTAEGPALISTTIKIKTYPAGSWPIILIKTPDLPLPCQRHMKPDPTVGKQER